MCADHCLVLCVFTTSPRRSGCKSINADIYWEKLLLNAVWNILSAATKHNNGFQIHGCVSRSSVSFRPLKNMHSHETQWDLLLILAHLFDSFQNKARTDNVPLGFFRRNSFTPLSSQDQIKRPRLYSVDNPPRTRMSQAPTLPSMQFSEASEGAELLQSQVSMV